MSSFVLDCSVAMEWCLAESESAIPQKATEILLDGTAYVPCLWRAEVVHVLRRAEKSGKLHGAQAEVFLKELRNFPIKEDHHPDEAWEDVLRLARKHNLSAYDATYLELALRLNLPLATLDKDLQKAAKKAGVKLVG